MTEELPPIKGFWTLEVYEGDIERDEDGRIVNELVEVIEGENLVVTAGKNLLLDRLFALSGPPSQVTHMGVGDSATAAAVGDTDLLAATNKFRKAFDSTPTRSGLVVTCVTTFATGDANFNWQELGLFNAASGGSMFNRIAPIGPFTKSSAVSIVVTVTITQA